MRTAMHEAVALVARDRETHARLTNYLQDAGFVIRELADAPPAAVWVVDKDDDPQALAAEVRPWLGSRSARRAVIITSRPTAVRVAVGIDERRLAILIPPVFPWQLVDALRLRGSAR